MAYGVIAYRQLKRLQKTHKATKSSNNLVFYCLLLIKGA